MGYKPFIADSVQQFTGSLPLHGKNLKKKTSIIFNLFFIYVIYCFKDA